MSASSRRNRRSGTRHPFVDKIRRVSLGLLALLLLVSTVAQGQGQQTNLRYHIDAKLDGNSHVVAGRETVYFTNRAAVAIEELYLHAYLNAFRNERSRFMRDAAAQGRSRHVLRKPGELVIYSVRAREFDDLELWTTRDPHSPGDPEDTTDIRLPLPTPLASGAPLTLDITFSAQLPELVERSGYVGGFHAVTQWFPKIARQTEDGRFAHFAYSALAEFSADFADYQVTLDVPATYVVAAPGQPQEQAAASGRHRTTYQLPNALDFAWFAWDQFVPTTTLIDGVKVQHFAASHQRKNAELTLDTLRWAMPWLSSTFTRYPYSSLIVVHPPDEASAAGAMEYPGLIVTGGPWYLGHSNTHFVESLTLHELSHQWFYGLLASDEYLHPVLDEGLASYVTLVAQRRQFGDGSVYSNAVIKLSEAPFRRYESRRHTRLGPLAQPAVAFSSFEELSGRVYARFATVLETLGLVYGNERLQRALGVYAERYRFKHPLPASFVEVIREQLGEEAAAALTTCLFEDGWVDYAVKGVSTQPRGGSSTIFHNRILLERRGNLSFPVTLEVVLENGQVLRRPLEPIPTRHWFVWDTTSPIVTATLDPDERITIDDDLTNQTRRVNRPPPPRRLSALLHAIGSVLLSLVWP